jgi:hypothetical protein
MFIPFYVDRSKFDIAKDVFTDAAWVAGYVVGFAIAVYEHFAAPTQTVALLEAAPEPVQPSPAVALTVNELRAQCKTAGIRWNRAGSGGRHLTKTEMIAALAVHHG